MTEHDQTIGGSLKKEEGSSSLPPQLLVTLEVIEGPDKGMRFEVKRSLTVLGRKTADLKLTDPTVSGRHAILEVAGNKIFLTDQASTNGCTINGEKIESGPAGNLDVIGLGDTRLLLSVVEDRYATYYEDSGGETADSRLPDDDSTAADSPLPNPPLPDGIYIVLEIREGEEQGRKFKVENRSTILGRGKKADFQIQDNAASARHCQIEIHNKDKMTLKDLASKNGTRLNGHYISAVKIRSGDTIQIGATLIGITIHLKR